MLDCLALTATQTAHLPVYTGPLDASSFHTAMDDTESDPLPSGPIGYDNLAEYFSELRALAHHFLQAESRNPTLTPTALVSTALRRAKPGDTDWLDVTWENRAHFFSTLSSHMRRALVDRARHRKAKGRDKVDYLAPDDPQLLNLAWNAEERPEEFLILDEARTKLAEMNPDLAEVLALFYDLKVSTGDIARIRHCCEKTVDRDLRRGRALLKILYKERATA